MLAKTPDITFWLALEPSDPFSNGLAILVVDDDETLRYALAETMVMDGYAVATADSVDSAHQTLDRHTPSVVILDLMLLAERSESVLARLSQLGDEAPVTVLVSAAHDASHVAEQYGVPFLLKPFDLEELSALIAGEVSRRKSGPGAEPR